MSPTASARYAGDPPTEQRAYVGRQAIFDRNLAVVGYELLFRNSEENRARFSDANQATASTMLNAFVEIGLPSLVGAHPAYVNLPADFLLGRYPIPMPPESTVIEVLEDVPVTPALLAAIAQLRASGFQIALDDFVLTDETRPLLALADIIKVDVLNVPHDVVAAKYAELRPTGAVMLAEKISTREQYTALHRLGFERFQGHFLELPVVSSTKRLPQGRAALLKILNVLYDPNVDLRAVETLLAAQVGLTVRLIKLASSVALSRGAPIGSIREAVLRIGVQQVAALVMLIMVAGFQDKPLELARQALIRARMCELLARDAGFPADQLFTAGLLSIVDAICDQPLHQLLDQLALTQLVRDGLCSSVSPAGKLVSTVRHQARGDLAQVAGGLPAQAVFVAWYEAIRWADNVMASI